MSRKYLLIKDKKKRKIFLRFELARLFYRSLYLNKRLKIDLRELAYLKLNKLPRNCLGNRVRNRCINTNSSRSVYKYFHLSRFEIKKLGLDGKINGLFLSSW